MTPEMISDFKKWSMSLGGEYVMTGVEPDIRKYISLGFCRYDFIKDMEYSFTNDVMFYDPIIEDPEYTFEEWEEAKVHEYRKLRNDNIKLMVDNQDLQRKIAKENRYKEAFLNLCEQYGLSFNECNF